MRKAADNSTLAIGGISSLFNWFLINHTIVLRNNPESFQVGKIAPCPSPQL